MELCLRGKIRLNNVERIKEQLISTTYSTETVVVNYGVLDLLSVVTYKNSPVTLRNRERPGNKVVKVGSAS